MASLLLEDSNIMKIGIWVSQSLETEGGGASYENHLISCIDKHIFSQELDCVFLTSDATHLNKTMKPVYLFSPSNPRRKELVLQFLSNIFSFSKKFKRLTKDEKHLRLQSSFRQFLKCHRIDTLYYPSQHSGFFLPEIPVIATNWDIGHLSTYPFPELTEPITFEFRTDWYSKDLNKAFFVVAESQAGREELAQFTHIGKHKIRVVPLFPGQCIYEKEKQDLLEKHGLDRGKFFFFPSQFWPHKNHVTLIDAFQIILKRHPEFKLVLSGSDKGNFDHVFQYTLQSNIQDRVIFPGFVTKQCIATLYRNAAALVMPTFLGPTNMPLLEARELRCPVLCSDLKGHREMMGEGALYFQPENANDIAAAMEHVISKQFSDDLLRKADAERKKTVFTLDNTMRCLEETFLEMHTLRKGWPSFHEKETM